ncbi:hypothetical protein ACF07D_08045 [Leucobacter sp. NPDC015123]|uniref:hypothetical protein n=1 Tax=Leucobacter sp. NPDC015123 TaxID=3364129 RepID=UPI0036F49C11
MPGNVGAQGSENEARLARLLFPDLADELDRAHAEGRRAAGGTAPASGAEAMLDAAALAARQGDLGQAAFSSIDGLEAVRFTRGFELAREVAGWRDLRVPEPEEFWAAGADHAALARALMADASLAVVPTIYGLGSDGWVALFRAAARQPSSPLSLAAPLILAPEVTAEFELLDAVPRGVAAVQARAGQAGAVQAGAVQGGEVSWTLRLVPATPKPPLVGLSHSHGPHPALPEILMLQLMHVAAREPLLDGSSFTWVHGTLSGGRFAARELFDTSERSVRVNTREVGNQGPHLGARPPIG